MSLQINAQKITEYHLECGTVPPSPEEVVKLPYYNNGQYLIDQAIEKGLPVEKDYIQKLTDENAGKSYADYKAELTSPSSGFKSFSSSSHYYIPVQAYVWGNSSGGLPFSGQEVEDRIDSVNHHFERNGVPISLYLLCNFLVGYNDAFFNVTSDSDWDNMASFPGPNALKVHFVEDGNGWAGIAKRPSSSTPYVCAIDAGSSISTLTHEIGHNLGLLHTHDGGRSLNDSNYDCSKCFQESVSRSKKQGIGCFFTSISDLKCEVNGDFLCDTPADPNLQFGGTIRTNGCDYDGSLGTDKWNDTWQPDERNIMSYSRRSCRNVLTPQQAFVMILNLPSFTLTSPGYFISGPSRLCPNQSASYSVSAISGVTDYDWEVPNGWSISGQGNRTVTITASSNSSGTISVAPNCGRPGVSKQITNQISTLNVSGPFTICEGESAYYSTSAFANSYTWSVFGDMQITSGQGSSSIQVYAPYGSQGGYVSVNADFGQCSSSNGIGVSVISGSGCYQYATAQDDSTSTLPNISEPESVNDTNQRGALFTEKQFDFSVYPNPGDNHITLSFDQEDSYTIELLDKQGKLIQNTQSICCEKSLNISSLKQGIYYLRVNSSNSVVTKKLFIK